MHNKENGKHVTGLWAESAVPVTVVHRRFGWELGVAAMDGGRELGKGDLSPKGH